MIHDPFLIRGPRFELPCHPRTKGCIHVMGILNVTPDSFSDGGRFLEIDQALKQAERLLSEGAAILDIGGASSRPRGSSYGKGADFIDAEEERERILPVVEQIRRRFPDSILSIDTFQPEVARACLEAGADIINDITGLRDFPEMKEVVAAFDAPLVLMHAVGKPGKLAHTACFDDVVLGVKESLSQSLTEAKSAGIHQLIIDPGFGFGKTPLDNLRLIGRTKALLDLGVPVLVGISRKSTIGAVLADAGTPRPLEERLFGTLGATAFALLEGASIIRTHDVAPTRDLVRVIEETWDACAK